jgi:hypothetical protein
MRCARGSGFSLIELVLALGLLLVVSASVGLALHSGVRATRELNEMQLVEAQAQTFMDRMMRLNFGEMPPTAPTSGDLDSFFGEGAIGSLSLAQLSKAPSGGWKFAVADFPVAGEWRVDVSQDLDGDKSIAGDMETGATVLAMRIYFNDSLILQSCKSKEPGV